MNSDGIDRAFVDTNVLIYSVSDEADKQQKARTLVAQVPEVVISAQVLSEFTNACLRRDLLTLDEIEPISEAWMTAFEVVSVDVDVIQRAYAIKRRYGYSWWDSVMLAAAVVAECEVVYTEDLQDQQFIDEQLRIENPFTSLREG